jgi:YgiT-type zinc finger domain-containing protein
MGIESKYMENPFRKCFFRGGDVDTITVGNFDYRLEGKRYVIKDTPAGLCLQCGEKYVTADTARKINALIASGNFAGTEEVRVLAFE